MMLRRWKIGAWISAVAAISFLAATTPAVAQICGEAMTVDLLAGQTTKVGTVTVSNDEAGVLSVTYSTLDDWYLTETHLHVSASFDQIPQTRKGNPKVGQFELQREYDPPVMEDTYEILLADEGVVADGESVLFIAAHAVVVQVDDEGNVFAEETAWAEGTQFPWRNWAMYIEYTVQACDGVPT